MANLELDPLFVKALRLLHSRNKDSADQLKQMLDDVLAQRKGHKGTSSGNETKSSSTSKSSAKEEEDKPKERKAEKHHLEKSQVKQEPKDFDIEVPAKKPRRDSPQTTISHSSERGSEPETKKDESVRKEKDSHKERIKKEIKKEPEWKEEMKKEKEKEKETKLKESSSSDDEKSIDADDFAFGLGIACVVCKGFDVASGNQLVECQECHTLYHQECHKPPVTEQDVNDPRFVWYCSRCSKSLKKMVSKPSKNKPSPTFVNKEQTETNRPNKSEPASLFSFRRVESKVSTSKDVSNNSGAKPMSGLASLAANLSGKAGDQVKSTSSKVEYTKSLLKPDMLKHSSSKSDSVEKVSLLNLSKSGSKSPSEAIKSSSKSSHESGKSSSKPDLVRSSSKSSSSEQLKSSSKQPSDLVKSSSKSTSESGKSSSKSSSEHQKSSSKSSSDQNKSSSKSSSDHAKSSSKSSSDSSKSSSRQTDPVKSSSKPSSSSSNKQSSVGGTASVVNADKRLQMMKKKAAAKLQEKRTSLK